MVVVLLTGSLAAGKKSVVKILENDYGWRSINFDDYIRGVSETSIKEKKSHNDNQTEESNKSETNKIIIKLNSATSREPYLNNQISSSSSSSSLAAEQKEEAKEADAPLESLKREILSSFDESLVIYSIHHLRVLDELRKRPFVIVIAVKSPVNLRYQRWQKLQQQQQQKSSSSRSSDSNRPVCGSCSSSYQAFMAFDSLLSDGCTECLRKSRREERTEEKSIYDSGLSLIRSEIERLGVDDEGDDDAAAAYSFHLSLSSVLFGKTKNEIFDDGRMRTAVRLGCTDACIQSADFYIRNATTVEALKLQIKNLNLESQSIFRPSFDDQFMAIADVVSSRSNCIRRRVGAVLTRNNIIISTGYNGTPRKTLDCVKGGCHRCRDSTTARAANLDACLCVHAEANALIQAGLDRSKDGWIYVLTFPCLACAKLIIQSCVKKVIYREEYDDNKIVKNLLAEANVEILHYQPKPFKRMLII